MPNAPTQYALAICSVGPPWSLHGRVSSMLKFVFQVSTRQ